jgi:micrococcal nuclease
MAPGADTGVMNRALRSTAVLVIALTFALIVGGCGTDRATPGSTGASGPGPAIPATPASIPGTPARPTGSTQDATLVRVVDGDTIRVMVGGVEERVRYIGIDTPELNTSSAATPDPYAEAATHANARLLAGGRIVLEKDVSERDQYGRLLRYIWIERDGTWTFVNLALVAEGYAQVSTYPPDVRHVDVLLAAQRQARDAGLGLWGDVTP